MATPTSTLAARVSTITPTIVATAGQLYTVTIASAAPSQSAAAQSILDKGAHHPNAYNPGNPLPLFIIQAIIIIALSRLLAWPLGKLKQPRVISEVVGGIVLGPSIMGRIPGFTQAIFPSPSIPLLSLVANIGLVLFLFLVGLEADFSVFKKNAKAAIGISVFGLVVPFGLGAAVSVGIYNRFVNSEDSDFGIFLLFIGTAMAITAFPVLARILTELKMLNNHVGLTVLAAGVGNDVVGWILLALSVALANAGSGVTAVYILLTGAGLCLFLSFIIRPAFVYLVRRSGSYERGPTPGIIALIFFMTLGTAFITDIIGIHAIFGAFLVGLIVVPHHHGFAAALTEKIEDLVTVLFIPLYFALSGLKTDLGLLNNGAIWGWVVCVIVVAFAGKFIPCAGVAKLCGFDWRESLAVGSLMSCKGLVELIVLNIGLQAGILNNEIFAMFVVMALVTTFVTTPLTILFYPETYWRKQQEIGLKSQAGGAEPALEKGDQHFRRNFMVVLERLESLPPMMAFIRLLGAASNGSAKAVTPESGSSDTDSEGRKSVDGSAGPDALLKEKPDASSPGASPPASSSAITVDAFRLLALSERTSDIMKASESDVTKRFDPILNIFSAFANLASLRHTTSMSIVPQETFAEAVTTQAASRNADMVIIPWAAGASLSPDEDGPSGNPLEGLFGQQVIERSPQYAAFVRRLFVESESDVGLFLDGGSSAVASPTSLGGHNHIFLPFHGGPDDRAALDFVMQLVANNSHISATVSRFVKTAESDGTSSKEAESSMSPLSAVNQLTVGAGLGAHDTVYAGAGTQHRLASDTADNLALARYFPAAMTGSADTANMEAPRLPHAVVRTTFETLSTASPLRTTLTRLGELSSTASQSVLLVLGRSRRSAPSHRIELESFLKEKVVAGHGLQSLGIAASSEVRKTLGDLGSAAVVSGQASSILILQSAVKGEAYMKPKKGKNV